MESLPKLSVLTKLVPHLTASMTKEDFSGARLLTSCRHYKADLVLGRSNILESVLILSFNFCIWFGIQILQVEELLIKNLMLVFLNICEYLSWKVFAQNCSKSIWTCNLKRTFCIDSSTHLVGKRYSKNILKLILKLHSFFINKIFLQFQRKFYENFRQITIAQRWNLPVLHSMDSLRGCRNQGAGGPCPPSFGQIN